MVYFSLSRFRLVERNSLGISGTVTAREKLSKLFAFVLMLPSQVKQLI